MLSCSCSLCRSLGTKGLWDLDGVEFCVVREIFMSRESFQRNYNKNKQKNCCRSIVTSVKTRFSLYIDSLQLEYISKFFFENLSLKKLFNIHI